MAVRKKAARKPAARPVRTRAAKPSRVTRPAKAAAKPRGKAAPKRPAGSARSTPAKAVPAPSGALAPNGKPVPSGIGLVHHHMDYSTHDPEGMRRFYAETLGFTNVLYMPEQRYLSVFITPGSSLGFMPPMGTEPEQWQPPGEPNFYFFVADVDRAFADLSAKGVSFTQAPTDMPWGHRVAILQDPEGRRVCLAQRIR